MNSATDRARLGGSFDAGGSPPPALPISPSFRLELPDFVVDQIVARTRAEMESMLASYGYVRTGSPPPEPRHTRASDTVQLEVYTSALRQRDHHEARADLANLRAGLAEALLAAALVHLPATPQRLRSLAAFLDGLAAEHGSGESLRRALAEL